MLPEFQSYLENRSSNLSSSIPEVVHKDSNTGSAYHKTEQKGTDKPNWQSHDGSGIRGQGENSTPFKWKKEYRKEQNQRHGSFRETTFPSKDKTEFIFLLNKRTLLMLPDSGKLLPHLPLCPGVPGFPGGPGGPVFPGWPIIPIIPFSPVETSSHKAGQVV